MLPCVACRGFGAALGPGPTPRSDPKAGRLRELLAANGDSARDSRRVAGCDGSDRVAFELDGAGESNFRRVSSDTSQLNRTFSGCPPVPETVRPIHRRTGLPGAHGRVSFHDGTAFRHAKFAVTNRGRTATINHITDIWM